MKYVFDLETTKIELHFAKADYDQLTADAKSALKSAYLWSNSKKAWVSRAKEPNLWMAKKVAKQLGFDEEERTGERLSFGEQIERQQERGEDRACRFEQYALNAERKAAALQKPINDMHGDIAFFTQPIIAGHAGSQAFARRRQRMFDQYDKGFAEYRKSEYFAGRADTARETASGDKYNDKAFVDRRIKEVKKEIRQRDANVTSYEESLYKLENGEALTRYDGTPITTEEVHGCLNRELELIGVAMDKEAWLQNKLDSLGGVEFSGENIKVGMIVTVQRWGRVEVIGKGKVNITFKILDGGAAGGCLQAAYAEIISIEKDAPKKTKAHPFRVGDSYNCHEWDGEARKAVARQYTIIKATDKSVTIQDDNGGKRTRKPRESKWSSRPGEWMLTITDCNDGTVYKQA